MFNNEMLTKNFIHGLSYLDSYIRMSNKTRLQDINIISEQFACEMLNTLYDWDLVNANKSDGQTPGYDLISKSHKLVIQVSSQSQSAKVTDSFLRLQKSTNERNEWLKERDQCLKLPNRRAVYGDSVPDLQICEAELRKRIDLEGYRVMFLFLCCDASNVRKSKTVREPEVPTGMLFDGETGILDFKTLTNQAAEAVFSVDKALALEVFMDFHADLFLRNIRPRDRVLEIIEEYAGNFEGRLFLHTYDSNPVTLSNLFVDPVFLDMKGGGSSRNLVRLLCDFLWQRPKNDRERILFIEGDAAIGKTSLVSWLCYHYLRMQQETGDSVGEAVFLNRRAVCVRLRELEFSEKARPVDAVLAHLKIPSVHEFEQRYANAILILDGADELSMVSRTIRSIEDFVLELRKVFSSHKLIITTRPKFLNLGSKAFQSSAFKIRRITLGHFDHRMRLEWLEKYKWCGGELSTSTEEYIRTMPDELAEGVADTPLALYLLARCDMRDELRGNSWALFHEIFSNAISKAEYNENFRIGGAVMAEDIARTNYNVVQNIAYRMFRNAREERYYLRSEEISEVLDGVDLNGMTKEQVRSTCVLCAYWKNTDTLGALEFYHNNIRAFFLCEYICDVLMRCLECHTDSELMAALCREFCRIFCWGDIPGTTWEQTFTFLYLRLRFESEHPSEDSLLDRLRTVEKFPSVISRLAAGKELWSHDSPEPPYLSAKRVFANSMMLVRVLMSFEEKIICFWHDPAEQAIWDRINLLKDWYDILLKQIRISDCKRMGIASRTVFIENNWSRQVLEGVSFRESNLDRVSFSHAVMEGSDFSDAVIRDGYFVDTDLSGATFINTHLTNCLFNNTLLQNVAFDGAHIEYGDWTTSRLIHNTFRNAIIDHITKERDEWDSVLCEGTVIRDSILRESVFKSLYIGAHSSIERVEFTKSVFSGTIENARFRSCGLQGCVFTGQSQISAEFDDCCFSNAVFEGAMEQVVFRDCSFYDCDFSALKSLRDVEFKDCHMNRVNFREMDLLRVRFINCDLRNATFLLTTMIQCAITGPKSTLQGADFVGAKNLRGNLMDANFYGANLHNSIGFENCLYFKPQYAVT